ncbi:MAG: biotin--[acetyl-CoA-carboxylase] ligase [Clostridia bacterium]|nr:biotin--[acetyl-CoA-carboxylase] ligase [Clostridia bacterium]
MIDLNIDIERIKDSVNVPLHIEYKDVTTSTNEDVKNLLHDGLRGNLAVIAKEQHSGRGRIGHKFSSPRGGIYLSLNVGITNAIKEKLSLLTPIAAVAVNRAIKSILGISTDIKWINDLYKNGKKICGILAEANVDNNEIKSVIIGIGIDYAIDINSINEDYKDVVGSLLSVDSNVDRANELIIALINNIYCLIGDLPDISFLDEYRAECVTIGKEISFCINNEKRYAIAKNVLDDGTLEVEENGKYYAINAGEVSIVRNK